MGSSSDTSPGVPCRPPCCSLEVLQIERDAGVVGLMLDGLWDCCQVVEVTAPHVMVGVPCPGECAA